MIALMCSAQLLFKRAGIHAHASPGLLQGIVWNPFIWIGLAISGAGLFCWLRTLRTLALPLAYPWTALIYVLTPVASVHVFDETLGRQYLIGIVLLGVGIFLSASGVREA